MAKEKLLGHEKGGGRRREGHIMVVRGRVTQPSFAKRGHLIWDYDNAVYMLWVGQLIVGKKYAVAAFSYSVPFSFALLLWVPLLICSYDPDP
jgi:hypothetical protein